MASVGVLYGTEVVQKGEAGVRFTTERCLCEGSLSAAISLQVSSKDTFAERGSEMYFKCSEIYSEVFKDLMRYSDVSFDVFKDI